MKEKFAIPQFKRDFEKQIMPHLQSDDASYVLRSCLGSDPATTVESMDDDISEMWKRLDEKYGDPTKVTDIIIDEIRRTRIIREGEEKRFVEFVEIVEDGYRDLKSLGLESDCPLTHHQSLHEERQMPNMYTAPLGQRKFVAIQRLTPACYKCRRSKPKGER